MEEWKKLETKEETQRHRDNVRKKETKKKQIQGLQIVSDARFCATWGVG